MPHIDLPEGLPGILGPLHFRPETAKPLNDLAEVLLRGPSTLTRGERELIAAHVSRLNDCHFCHNAHATFAALQLDDGWEAVDAVIADPATDQVSPKLRALLAIAGKVQRSGREVHADDIEAARAEGATDVEIHDTVLIAAAFCMFNRYVDGLATWAPPEREDYAENGRMIVEHGYAATTPASLTDVGDGGEAGQAWFDRWVDTYDAERRLLIPCFDRFYGTAAEVASLGRGAGARVLDLGAGTGLLAGELTKVLPEATFTVLDEAPAMLEQAKERLAPLGDRVSTVVADLRDPLPDGPFDVVASALAIHHLDDAAKSDLYERVAEVLAPGGVLVNAEQVAGPTATLDRWYRELWRDHCRAAGASEEQLAAADIRMSIDLPASVPAQLEMLRNAGLVDVDAPFRWWRFAVLVGWAPG